MKEKKLIKNLLDQYAQALETDDMQLMADLLCEDVVLESTNYGNAIGKDEVINKLKWQGIGYNYARYKIFNYVCFHLDITARSSCVMSALIGLNQPDYFHYFQFSGYYLNDYKKIDGKWKISKIRFNLDMEDGNTLFVNHWWKLIDYRYFEGASHYPICSEVENPWDTYYHANDDESEDEQVLDALFRYAWGIDHADFKIFATCCNDFVKFAHVNSREELKTIPDDVGMNKSELIRFMKYKRYKEPTMEHIYKVKRVEILNGKAIVEVYRYEPHRLGTTKLNKLNMNDDFYSGHFYYEFIKKEGTYPEGGWKMTLNGSLLQKTFYETTYEKRRFYSEL